MRGCNSGRNCSSLFGHLIAYPFKEVLAQVTVDAKGQVDSLSRWCQRCLLTEFAEVNLSGLDCRLTYGQIQRELKERVHDITVLKLGETIFSDLFIHIDGAIGLIIHRLVRHGFI